MHLLRQYIRSILHESPSIRRPYQSKLRVFDFDDTLVKTGSKIHVTDASGKTFDLTPGEYAVYVPTPGDQFDYSDFEKLVDPQTIQWTAKILRNITDKGGEVVILTARANPQPVREFLQQARLPDLEVVALGDSNPEKKADYIRDRIEMDGLEHVEFFDDSYKNIEAVRRLQGEFPTLNLVVRHITH